MSKKIAIKAGERKRIFRLFSSSIASTVRFNAEAVNGGDTSGTVEVDRWHWFNWKKETQSLGAENAVDKGFADADFIIHVIPDQDCEITFPPRTLSKFMFMVMGAAVLIVIIAVAMVFLTAGAPVSSVGN